MKKFFVTTLRGLSSVVTAWCGMVAIAYAQQSAPTPPPDAAAHTVIVPFDPEKPLKEQKAERFYLDYAAFQDLWAKAKENRRPEKPEKDTGNGVTVNLAMHDVEVRDAALVMTSRFQIGSRGEWQSIHLPLAAAGTGEADWKLDGRTALLKDGSILVEKPGAHQVEAALTTGLTRGWQEAALKIPPAAASLLRIAVPLTDGLPDITPEAQASLVSEEVREGKRVFTLVLNPGQSGEWKLKRQAARRSADQAAPAVCEIKTDLTVRSRVEQVHSRFHFSFPGAERSSFVISMEEGARPVDWGVPGLKDILLKREGGRLFAEVRLLKPARDAFFFTMLALRPQDALEGERKAPSVGAQAARVERVVELRAHLVLRVSVSVASGAAARIATGTPVGGGAEPAIGAWRLHGDDTFGYTVAVAEDTAAAEVEMLTQVGMSKLEILVAATLRAGRLPLHEAYMRLPQGYEVQSVQGAGIRGWQRDESGVFVQFDGATGSEARLVLNAAATHASGEPAATLPVVLFENMAKQKVALMLAVNAATDVRAQFDRAWREVDPQSLQTVFTVSPPWVTKRALLWEPDTTSAKQPPPAPVVTLIPQPPKFSADTVLLVRSADEMLGFSQQVGVAVEQGAVSGLKVRLPAALPEARVGGPDVRDVQITTQGEMREYSVTFQGEILGTASVTFDWEQPPATEAILPLAVVEGASRSRRFFILENNSSREMKTALTRVEKTVASAVPWLPEGLASADLYQARSADAEMKLTFSNTQATAGNAAIVTLAEITTALRPNGERWETVVYSLANRSLQFLPVRLPKSAELVTVMVGDEMVRADWGTPATVTGEKAAPCHLVPLIQMRAGQLSQQVRLTYFVPAKEGSALKATAMMDDPELAGLSAERTLWNVWVPEGYELDEFDGNMEEVVQEVMEDEKVQQKLSDVLRLNRIVSMSSTSESDAKEALGNATKALEEVTRYQEGKKTRSRSSYDSDSKPTAKAKAQGTAVDEAVRSKSNEQLELQLQQQKRLLTENSGKLEKFSKSGSGTFQLQGALGSFQGQIQGAVNAWNANGDVAAKPAREGKVMLQGANTVINDNVAVGNDFLMPQQPQNQNESAAGEKPPMPQQRADATGNITLNNARGAANFTQADGANINFPGDGRVTGHPVPPPTAPNLSTGSTMQQMQTNGTVVISGGVPLSAPASSSLTISGSSMRDGASTLTINGAAPAAPRPSSAQEGLQAAYSHYNLGDFDKANTAFQDVLRMDPYNTAARRGLERIDQVRSDSFAKPADHTRARMLNDVNRGWETPVPVAAAVTPQLKPQGRVSLPVDVPLTGTVYHFRKLKDHAALELDIEQPLEPGRRAALWVLLAGATLLAAIAWLGRKRGGASKWQGA